MRRYLFFLFFLFSLCFTTGAEARKFALLVGIDDYANFPSLNSCVNDMKALKEALKAIGFEEKDIQLIVTNSDDPLSYIPTKKNIEQKVAEILAAAKPDDIVFFAFSGYGAREEKTDYFCPPLANLNNIKGTCVSITKAIDDLSKCQAKFKWVVVDACRNDPNNSQDPKAFQVIPAPPAGIALFQSCNKGEKSYEDNRAGGRGYFMKNLVTALSGEADADHDGKLTLLEVCSWTTAQTHAEVKKAENKTQQPFLYDTGANFNLSEDVNVPKEKDLLEAARKAVNNYKLTVEKFNKALKHCPKSTPWEIERDSSIRSDSKPKANLAQIKVPEDFATIDEAYEKIKDGGIITIQPGKYKLFETLVVNRSVTFRGSTGRAEDVVIDCPYSDAIKITDGSPSFENLTASSGGETCGGFWVTGGTPKLFRCTITSRNGDGMYVTGKKANPSVESCTMKNCSGAGVRFEDNGLGTFKDCDIYGNELAGVKVKKSSNPTFIGCKIHDGKQGGVFVFDNGLGNYNDCDIYGNELAGIEVRDSSNPTFTGCKIYDGKKGGVFINENGLGNFNDCEIYGNELAGIEVGESGNPTVTGCKIYDGKQDGVFINENGLGKFNDCDIYGNSITGVKVIKSGNPTITGCKIHDGKMSGVYVNESGLGKFSGCEIYGNKDSGILVNKSSNPTVVDCNIHSGNSAGIGILNGGLGTFKDCDISKNDLAGIAVETSSNPTVTGCKIHDNIQYGLYIYESGLGKFSDCEIYENTKPGIAVETSGNPTVTRCRIHNGKMGGVYIHNKGMGTFNNNTLKYNYTNGKLDNWDIRSDAGRVTGYGNSPSMSSYY